MTNIINLDTLFESCSLIQAGVNIEALALNEIVKEVVISECDEQKHPTEQKKPRRFSVQDITDSESRKTQ